MRDAESLLDQLASYDEGGITVQQMRAALGIGADETVMRLTEALAAGDVAQGLGVINLAVEEGADPRQFARQVVEHLRVLLLLRLESGVVPPYVSETSLPRLRDQATAFSRRQLIRAVRLFNRAAQEAKGGWQPQLPLEMAFVEALLPREPDDEGGGDPSSGRTGGSRSGRRGRSGTGRGTASSASPRAAGRARSEPQSGQHAGPPAQTDPSRTVRESMTSTYRAVGDGDSPLTPAVVVEHWPDFLNALRPEDLKLEALMRSCEPVGVEGEVIVLRFAHEFHRSKVEEQAKRRLIEDALSNLFGRRLRVRCVVDWQGEAGPLQADHRPDPAPRPGVSEGGTLAAFDPLVQMAVDELGAEVASG
jgi:DNA polymerase-3 subunit gamma/tau